MEAPWALALLLALAALAVWRGARAAPSAIPWPSLDELETAGGRRREWLAPLAWLLRGGALAALAVALAGPVQVFRGPPEGGDGLDLVLVLDASGSMRALDAERDGAWRSRLELARDVVLRFASRRVADGDRVGLVVFGETAFTLSPLSTDGTLLSAALARVEPGIAGEATALGDALALAVKRVTASRAKEAGSRRPDGVPGEPERGSVVVLLTDGRSNAGDVPPDVAAALARTLGVRVHAVGIGREGPVAMAARPGTPGAGLRFERHDLDRETLAMVARSTGGRLFEAKRAEDLEAVYAEIDGLERVPRRGKPRLRRAPRPEPALAVASGLLGLEILATRVLRRRLS